MTTAIPMAAEAAAGGGAAAGGAAAGGASGAGASAGRAGASKAGGSKGSQLAESAAGAGFASPGKPKSSSSKKSDGKRAASGVVSWAWSGNRKLLTAQFLVCVVVLGLGTLLTPSGAKDGMPRALVKGSALCGVFLVLSLITTGGKGAAKAATAIGTLVTASYVLTSRDVHNVVSWLNAFFSKDGNVKTSGSGKGTPENAPDLPGSEADEEDGGVIAV